MDRTFLHYYESELEHIRDLASEFAALHPAVATNLSLDTTPCPDPYVERLLEGVAYLAARTRLKVDAESSRHVRNLLDALYPDMVAPAPAMSMAALTPGDQVEAMVEGYTVPRGTRMISGLRDGLTTRATYTTAQDVALWPIEVAGVQYLQDIGALRAAGFRDGAGPRPAAGIRLTLKSAGPTALNTLKLDTLDLYLGHKARGGQLFDALHGHGMGVMSRADESHFETLGDSTMVGIRDAETLLPQVRDAFQGYGLIREYFLMPERFHYIRLHDLQRVVPGAKDHVDVLILLDKVQPDIADISPADFQLFVTPIVNLFERECNVVDLDPGRASHAVHPDRTRPLDYEVFRLIRVEDIENDGPGAQIPPIFAAEGGHANRLSYSIERQARRPSADEVRRGQMRTSYAGDNVFIALSHDGSKRAGSAVRRLDIRALCTNRDLPILDDNPQLTLDSGAPVSAITLLQAIKRPRSSLPAVLPAAGQEETRRDELNWRWISQLSLNHVSLAEAGTDAAPLRALLALYADRGDPTLVRHAQALRTVSSGPLFERLPIKGPICFGHGTEITLDIDEGVLSGHSQLLLSALLAQLLRRQAAINAVVRTKTRLAGSQEEVVWPLTLGNRTMI
ncbi:type VI secretion system baseplate subunit TssF [Cognatiyoonia sp. IB215446]|uniref:type VI secretion system baseplate subunit TssF n=1 Tax=Cognatiyoonia sp. IB215446 TaxID=3097355 RepID=UPI002A17F11C|nr:type VI secretion system baseplate subunit TssF [Cognatiyoonia sp. IB215446]MDX8346603.1 type VI secretion system baseplate subunit TssF [Cognatiyoonia sp. IB215446]